MFSSFTSTTGHLHYAIAETGFSNNCDPHPFMNLTTFRTKSLWWFCGQRGSTSKASSTLIDARYTDRPDKNRSGGKMHFVPVMLLWKANFKIMVHNAKFPYNISRSILRLVVVILIQFLYVYLSLTHSFSLARRGCSLADFLVNGIHHKFQCAYALKSDLRRLLIPSFRAKLFGRGGIVIMYNIMRTRRLLERWMHFQGPYYHYQHRNCAYFA